MSTFLANCPLESFEDDDRIEPANEGAEDSDEAQDELEMAEDEVIEINHLFTCVFFSFT